MKVGTGSTSASTTSRASITRESSPPEAPLPSGRGTAVRWGASMKVTVSRPCTENFSASATSTTREAFGMARAVSSSLTASASFCAAARRRAVSSSAWAPSTLRSCTSSVSRVSCRCGSSTRVSRRARDSSAHSRTSAISAPYLRVRVASWARRVCTCARRSGPSTSREAM